MISTDLTPGEKAEYEALVEIEQLVRDFAGYVDTHTAGWQAAGSPVRPFAPRTVETVEALRPLLSKLDEARRDRAA